MSAPESVPAIEQDVRPLSQGARWALWLALAPRLLLLAVAVVAVPLQLGDALLASPVFAVIVRVIAVGSTIWALTFVPRGLRETAGGAMRGRARVVVAIVLIAWTLFSTLFFVFGLIGGSVPIFP